MNQQIVNEEKIEERLKEEIEIVVCQAERHVRRVSCAMVMRSIGPRRMLHVFVERLSRLQHAMLEWRKNLTVTRENSCTHQAHQQQYPGNRAFYPIRQQTSGRHCLIISSCQY